MNIKSIISKLQMTYYVISTVFLLVLQNWLYLRNRSMTLKIFCFVVMSIRYDKAKEVSHTFFNTLYIQNGPPCATRFLVVKRFTFWKRFLRATTICKVFQKRMAYLITYDWKTLLALLIIDTYISYGFWDFSTIFGNVEE